MNFIIHRRITICMLFLALTLLGYVSYKQLKAELLPNAELPMLTVQISSNSDLDPKYMEAQAVIPLEGAISTVDGVEKTESNLGSRWANIRVDFKKNVNFKYAALKLQQKINEAAQNLPEGFTVSVQKADLQRVSNANFMALQVRGSGGVNRVRNIVDEKLKPEFEKIDGVATVLVYGGREKAIEIRIDPEACKSLNINYSRLSGLLSQNSIERTFVGYADEATSRYFVHVDANFTSVSEIENIVVAPGPIYLKDIANVFFGLKEEDTYSRVNGKESVSINLVNDSQSNLIDLSHRVTDKIDLLNKEMADLDIEIVVQNNTAETIENNINQITDLAITGGLLAIIILWFFLKNIRLVFFIALSIPISIFTAFNLFYAYDITINSLTLIGMALAVGMLLDNSIVVLENIYRLSATGLPPEKAVTQGTKEVWRSILASTLTTITVFLPFIYSDNFLIKLMGSHIGVSIISTLFVSLAVALLFIPMSTYLVLKRNVGNSVFYEKLSINQRPIQIYMVLLKSCLRKPAPIIFGAIALLFILIMLSGVLTASSQKSVETDRFNINISVWGGSTLENTDKMIRVIEERLQEIGETKDLACRIEEESATLTLILDKDKQKASGRKMVEIREDILAKVGQNERMNVQINEGVSNNNNEVSSGLGRFMRMMGIGNNSERIVLKGSDYETMQVVAEDLRYYLDEMECITNTWQSWESRRPEIRLNFDPILLNSYEITRGNISSGLNSLNTNFSTETKLKIGDEEYSIMIREDISEEDETKRKRLKSVDELKEAQISNANNGLHSLQSLASVNYGRGIADIRRIDREKQIELYYNYDQNAEMSKKLKESYRDQVNQLVENYNLPTGVAIEVIQEEDAFGDFKFLIMAAFILIFMILASVFESLFTPFVLLFTIPLAAIGSLAALILTGNSLENYNTLMGFLILLGVVVNNGIILIDYANILRKRGFRRNRALIYAGLSRIRPILITSATTIIAMLPLAMGDNEYAGAIGAPFAITVIGGLSFSALLTLIFIPTINSALENALAWYKIQSKKMYVVHALIYAGGLYYIYDYVDGLLWQSIYLILLTALIPSVSYFLKTSLRRAETKLINHNDEIRIQVSNLVKIYERPNRFIRQWESGVKLRRRLGLTTDYRKVSDFKHSIWQIILFGFGVYFTYFYLENKFWIFVLSFAMYGGIRYFKKQIDSIITHKWGVKRWFTICNKIAYWAIPLLFIAIFYFKLDNVNFVIFTAVVWALALKIAATSDYLYSNDVNIERITGRFKGFRRSWFRMVKSIPVIGKKKRPFKALKGISFDIKTGMFGLLGPNGAGKSTMMRIVCGILDQSYGSIWINGLDTQKYREELQSLIGFLPQEFGTYENMTSWEFLDYQAILKGITDPQVRKERLEYVLKAVHMYERKDAKIGSFSGGMKQRIGIALILLHLPRILVVDEPTAGLDPRERIRFRNLLVELSKNRIVIFSTHIIEDISSSCNQVVVINKGELKYFGEPNDMEQLAQNKIWSFNIPEKDFEEKLDKQMVVNHMQDGEEIRVRYISIEKPTEDAILVTPNLEDAYLCLLKNI